MLHRDHEATIAKHFEDKRSYVAPDGREVLYGKDWKARKYMLWCQVLGHCEIPECPRPMEDAHHAIPRSKGRDDRLQNLVAICRYHHELLDKRKPQWTKRLSAK